ncbi:MAG: LTA synthase family protein [Candidatus Anaerobiospirillum pullicola]|uniref:LTA synthase family protein n=1 Tax=Candidatus Anaerobiospirillum pullicola TaxID=2838451 RepID=A0A948TG39_9GAMM|nr:LTA synthase family protein [Candidatus Anaerobiospirillum pullicola]
MALLSVSRIGLMLWQWEVIPEGGAITVLLYGLRFDFASVCGLLAPVLLLLSICSLLGALPRVLVWIVRVYLAAAGAFLIMNEAATPGFILEYGVRPNNIYVKYLIYPTEVIKTLWGGHKLELLLSLMLTAAALVACWYLSGWAFKRLSQQAQIVADYSKDSSAIASSSSSDATTTEPAAPTRRLRWLNRGLILAVVQLFLVLTIVPLGIRSTLGHRPLNPSMAAFCPSPLVNSLPVNSSYSAAYALAHLNDTQVSSDNIYKLLPENEVLAAAQEFSMRTPAKTWPACPLRQHIAPYQPGKLYNVVVVLEESMGADFVASLGGLPLTPELEKLKDHGWWFSNLYAAGHRSIRGIEAVTAGFPPSPLESIVKLPAPSATSSYASLAAIFKQKGYATTFVYGGESHFDNMRSYFLANGMDNVIEQKDYTNPQFVASWGVSDEDLFNRAHELFSEQYAAGQKFFAVIFSSSFHDPFDIPPGKVAIDDPKVEASPRNLAVKYADYALGQYMKKALSAEYGKDTVFLVIADHESKVRGQGAIPVNKFHIPGVIIAPSIEPHVDNRIVSQIDMPVTLLSLAGFSGAVPLVGQNLLLPNAKERAVMQYNDVFALYDQKGVISLTPQRPAEYFAYHDKKLTQTAADSDQQRLQLAAGMENVGPLFYQKDYASINCVTWDEQVAPAPASAAAPAAALTSSAASPTAQP